MSSTILTDNLKLTNPLAEIYGGTGQSTYTTGDLLYASGTNQLSKLAIGSTGYVLTSTGTVPVYSTVIPTSETINVSTILTPITPNIDYTFLNCTATGNAEWATRISGINIEIINSITTDSTGVYAMGTYQNIPIKFYNSNDTEFQTFNSGTGQVFIVKYDTLGFGQWTARIGSVNGSNNGQCITTDSTGVYVIGYYQGSPATIYNYDGTPFGTLVNSSGNSAISDVFIVKYNTSGLGQWATRIGGTSNDSGYGITTDSTGVYVIGEYTSSPVTIYNYNGTPFGTLNASGVGDSFVVKYDTSGLGQWATRMSGDVVGYSITTDPTGVYVTGNYLRRTLTIYNSNGTPFGTLANSGDYDAFIVKYNTSGYGQWATRIADIFNSSGYSITTDSTGVYVTGSYMGSVTIYNSNDTPFGTLVNSSGNYDAFIVKYNTSGYGQWATRIAGTGTDQGFSITTDLTGVYVTGMYTNSNPVTIYNSNGTVFGTLNVSGAGDAFVVKYNTDGYGQWASRISGGDGHSITTNSTGVYAAGMYSGPATVYNSSGTPFKTLANSGVVDAFIVKYESQINLALLPNRSFIGSKVISTLNDGYVNITVNNLVHNGITMTTLTLDRKGEAIRLGWDGTYWFVISSDGVVIS